MKLSEMFRAEVVTAEPNETIRAAAEKMEKKNVGAIVVIQGRKVAGIVTDRDIALKVASGKATPESPVSEIMTYNVTTIWDDQGVFNATQYVRGKKVRRLPIIDRENNLVGVLTVDDLIALLSRELLNTAQSFEPAIGTTL